MIYQEIISVLVHAKRNVTLEAFQVCMSVAVAAPVSFHAPVRKMVDPVLPYIIHGTFSFTCIFLEGGPGGGEMDGRPIGRFTSIKAEATLA